MLVSKLASVAWFLFSNQTWSLQLDSRQRSHKPRGAGRAGVRFDLVPGFSAPDDQPHTGRSGSAKRHRPARLGFHLRPLSQCEKVLRD